MHIEKIYVNGMINAGVSGYVLKSCSFKELLDCISRVLADDSYFCQEINHMVDHHDKNHGADKNISVFSLLSRREIEVLQLIAEGYRSRKIADKLNISVKTVDIHRTHLKEKLNIHTIAQLTKFAISEGVTPAHL
ncbi:MAG: response regulator transcription factor, partial [Proteobacteria bacterium]|nr:response regulator transcription factor [Pseudomonadota bacterium]